MSLTPALAQAAPQGGEFIFQLLPFVLIFVIMYFLIIRPQQKRLKDHREMVSNIRRGDTVITGGGVVGKVVRVMEDSDEVQVEIAENTRIRVVRGTIAEVRSKSEPVEAAKKS